MNINKVCTDYIYDYIITDNLYCALLSESVIYK